MTKSALLFQSSLVRGLAAAIPLLAFAQPAAAQDQVANAAPSSADSDGASGDIVVSGIRNSLRTAIAEKRDAVTIVDVINAEDVGKLPDQNLAEVLENIPGVQIDRNRGVGSGVSIRGSSQNLVLINGRSTTPAADARGGISFDDLPAELIASVRVTKVPTADQIEGSVGGLVDLRTYRGLALKEPIRTIRADMEYAETADSYNPHLAAIFGQKFDTGIGEIGVVLAGNYLKQTVREDQLNVRYLERTTVDLTGDGVPDPYLRPNFAQQFYSINDRTNTSLSGSLEWRPSSDLTFFVDGTYVNQKNVGSQIGVFMQQPNDVSELPFQSQANIQEQTSSGYTYRQMMSGVIGGTQFRSTGESPIRDTESYLAAMGGEWATGDLTLKFEASRAGSDTLDANFQTVAQYSDPTGANFGSAGGRISPPFLFDAGGQDLYWAIDRSSPLAANIGNPAYYQTFIARDNYTYYHNVENAQRVDASWDIGWGPLHSIDAGVRFNQTDSRRRKTTQVSAQFPGVVASSRPDLFQIAPDDFFDFTDDTYTGGWVVGRPLTEDPAAVRAAVGLAATPPEDLGARFQVKERTYAGYLKTNIDTTIAGMRLRGDIGARLVHTDQTASGVAVSNGVVSDVSATQKYTKVLPGVVFALEPASGVTLRASYAKSLRRPDFGQLAPTVIFPIINNYVSAGNPALKPQTVDQFDLDAEWYFDRNSLFSVGLFYKKFHDLVATVAVAPQLRDPALGSFVESNCIGGIWNPVAVDLTGAVGICTGINQPQNLGSATLKGVEVNFQHSFTYLPGALSGFGILANYTYQDGKRDTKLAVPSLHTVDGTPVELSLPLRDLSKNNYNITLFYEKAGFSARVRYTFRDPFLRTEATDVTNNLPLYQEERSQLNASISYDINPYFAITVSGVNLTKEPIRETAIFADGPLTQERSADRRFAFGVRGKL